MRFLYVKFIISSKKVLNNATKFFRLYIKFVYYHDGSFLAEIELDKI